MRNTNTVIVGQGLAGSLVAYMLYQRNIPFIMIDPGGANTASRIAAGMFTPISGKRKTIQPMVLQQIPFAINVYREIEQLLSIDILHLQNIYQVHQSETAQNEWNGKLKNHDFAKYMLGDPQAIPGIKQLHGAAEITHSGWLDCRLFIESFARWLQQKDALIAEGFLYAGLQLAEGGMRYREIEFSNIIFCEGYQAADNPFFFRRYYHTLQRRYSYHKACCNYHRRYYKKEWYLSDPDS